MFKVRDILQHLISIKIQIINQKKP